MHPTLQSITDTILDESTSRTRLREVLDDFSRLCTQVGGIKADVSFDGGAGDELLPTGVAINPQAAAHCVADYGRTVAFIRGVNAAIAALLPRVDSGPLKILYAGCGPFATLLLPLIGRFGCNQLEVTLLDIHSEALDCVNRLVEHFGLAQYGISTVQADASVYQHHEPLHLIVAETMQKALEQEPQLAVTANLVPQLHPQGEFVPQEVAVDLCLAQLATVTTKPGFVCPAEIDVHKRQVASLVRLNRSQISPVMATSEQDKLTGATQVLATVVSIPGRLLGPGAELVMFTRIQVFGPYTLEDYESEITLPSKVHDIPTPVASAEVAVAYHLGKYPRFSFSRQ